MCVYFLLLQCLSFYFGFLIDDVYSMPFILLVKTCLYKKYMSLLHTAQPPT